MKIYLGAQTSKDPTAWKRAYRMGAKLLTSYYWLARGTVNFSNIIDEELSLGNQTNRLGDGAGEG